MKGLDIQKRSLSDRILITLAYFDVFGFGMSLKDLSKFILGESPRQNNNLLKIELIKLKNEIVDIGGKYFLKNTNPVRLLNVDEVLKKASNSAKWFEYIPFVEFVAVCNYLPIGIADQDSDIDVLIITKVNRIFMARLFTTVILHVLRLRRHGKKVSGRFCLSFYANEAFLDFSDLLIDNDIYFAYWLLALYPIYGDISIYENIQSENQNWMKYFFAEKRTNKFELTKKKSLFKKVVERFFSSKLGDWIEALLTQFFIARNNAKSSEFGDNASIVVNSRRLKFHNNDRRMFYRDVFYKNLKRLGLL